MRILMLTWDFPPAATAGLSRQVAPLSAALVAAGHQVTVVTRHAPGAPPDEWVNGVRVVRPPDDPPTFPLPEQSPADRAAAEHAPAEHAPLAWTMAVNHTLTRAGLHGEGYDVIHAHGWLVTHAAITLKEHLDVPLVATIHTTEAGRHQGFLPDDTNRSVHSVEWWLGTEACRVLVGSDYLRWEVSRLFDVSPERVDTVPVGLDPTQWRASPRAVAAARLRFAGEGPLVVYAGRLVAEKGVQDLLAAATQLRIRHPGTRVAIAGDGPYRTALIEQARQRKLHRAVSFPGRLDADTLAAVLGAADAVVLPSQYEPIGMIALEAAAAGAPLAVAATGALASFIEPGVTGTRFRAGDVDSLVDAVSALIGDPLGAQTLAIRARQVVEKRHSWPVVAARTAAVYASAVRQSASFEARRATDRLGSARPVVLVPPGNLLAGAPTYAAEAPPDAPNRTAWRPETPGDDDLLDAVANHLDAVADDPMWTAGAAAARAAMRAEADRAEAAARETAERDVAARVAADALDVVLAATQRV
jgi:glycogen(starch) synthase